MYILMGLQEEKTKMDFIIEAIHAEGVASVAKPNRLSKENTFEKTERSNAGKTCKLMDAKKME